MNPTYSQSPRLEKDLDSIIRRNMKGESFFSPLNFSPVYQQDNYSRLKLRGYKDSNYNPFFPDSQNQFYNQIKSNQINERNKVNEINNQNYNINADKNSFLNTNKHIYQDSRSQGAIKTNNNRDNNIPQYSPLIKNANNILEIQNKPRIAENENIDQNKYTNFLYKDINDNQINSLDNKPELEYLDNKYLYNTDQKGLNDRIDNCNNISPTMRQDNFEMTNNYSKTPNRNSLDNPVSIESVNHFSISNELIPPQQLRQPNYNNYHQINNNYEYYPPQSYNNKSENNGIKRKNMAKNETFSNSVDHSNRNMTHLLRKY